MENISLPCRALIIHDVMCDSTKEMLFHSDDFIDSTTVLVIVLLKRREP